MMWHSQFRDAYVDWGCRQNMWHFCLPLMCPSMSLSMHMPYLGLPCQSMYFNVFQDSSLTVRQFCLTFLWIFCQTRSAVHLAASPKYGKPVAFCSSWDSLIHPFPGWRRRGINYVSIKNWESLRAHVAWAKGLSEAKPEGEKNSKASLSRPEVRAQGHLSSLWIQLTTKEGNSALRESYTLWSLKR